MTESTVPESTSTADFVLEHRIVLSEDEVRKALERYAAEKQPEVQLPGFRPGKAPLDMIVNRLGANVWSETKQELLSRKMSEQVGQNPDAGRMLAGPICLEIVNDEATAEPDADAPSGATEYVVRYQQCPEVPDIDLSQIKLERVNYRITDPDVERWMQDFFTRFPIRGEAEPARVAQFGDAVVFRLEVKVGQETFTKGDDDKSFTRAGMSPFGTEVNVALLGAKAGNRFRFQKTMSADHPEEKLRGKVANFDLQVQEVAPIMPPTADDVFARAAGYENAAQLLERARRKMEAFVRRESREDLHIQLREAIVAANNIPLPPQIVWQTWMQDREIQPGGPDPSFGFTDKEMADTEFMLRGIIAHHALVERLNIRPTEDQMIRAVTDWLNPLPPTNEQLRHLRARSGTNEWRGMEYEAEREMLLDMVMERGQVVDKEEDFAKLWA